jgi:tRNA U34 5-carboxymethylaminomethyl modifying enzyme MnmG/GidA
VWQRCMGRLHASVDTGVPPPRRTHPRPSAAASWLMGRRCWWQVLDGAVADLMVEPQSTAGDAQPAKHRVRGVVLASGEQVRADAVVITTGTFLRGVIHIGSTTRPAGRMPSADSALSGADATAQTAASGLAATIARLGFRMSRMKTGTPPRLDGTTIDYSGMEPQPSMQPAACAPRASGFLGKRQR